MHVVRCRNETQGSVQCVLRSHLHTLTHNTHTYIHSHTTHTLTYTHTQHTHLHSHATHTLTLT
ncbi:hypothetical protein LEMLEM_LOCUS3932, partial [Lemmus lemmus]